MPDEPAETLIAEIWWLHRALADRLAQVEADHVSVSVDLERVSGSSREPDEALAERAATIAKAAGKWRARRKAQLQALRRLKRSYEVALELRAPPSRARPPTVTEDGRNRLAVQSVGPDGQRIIEGEHARHTEPGSASSQPS